VRLERLAYKDKDSEWELEPLDFLPDLNLLVGVSGVGKTRILESIVNLKAIAEGGFRPRPRGTGRRPWGIAWNATFYNEGKQYQWVGEFRTRKPYSDEPDSGETLPYSQDADEAQPGPTFVRESLAEDGKVIVERDSEGIRLRGNATPKLSPFHSVLVILNEEEGVSSACAAFKQIMFIDNTQLYDQGFFFRLGLEEAAKQFKTLQAIRRSDFPTFAKLYLAFKNVPEVFEQVKSRFISVFPMVKTIDITIQKAGRFGDIPRLRMREHDVGKWIPEQRISSGMLRTLEHLSRMLLWPDGTVTLIDEFENSLGVNCIDFITKDLVNESRRLQFIVTSHHPYIINNIDTRHWKIVTRRGHTVAVRDANGLGLEASRHQAFIKLINLEAYSEGIHVP